MRVFVHLRVHVVNVKDQCDGRTMEECHMFAFFNV